MLIDSHCHLKHHKYAKPVEQLISEASQAGVEKLITIGTSFEENAAAIGLAEKFANVFATVAIYPHEELGISLETLKNRLESQMENFKSKKIVAIGECGIDISEWKGGRLLNEQIEVFEMQLELAIKYKLPVVIHNRGGDRQIFSSLDKYVSEGITGVAHCFSGSFEVAQEYIKRGFYISFAGRLTYKSSRELQDVATKIPLEAILVETDAPYLPPEGYRGQLNEPRHVVEVAKKLSELKKEPFDKIANFTYSNTYKAFKLDKYVG